MEKRFARRLDRRSFVRLGFSAALVLPALACGGESEPAPQPGTEPTPEPPAPAPPAEPAAAADPPPAAGTPDSDALVTEIPAISAQVTALQYVNESVKPDQNCENCQFFTAGEGGLGKCQLFTTGRVRATGWCSSWVARAT